MNTESQHERSLSAERKERERAGKAANDYYATICELRDQLTAERQRREQAERALSLNLKMLKSTDDQLLSALAAIEKHNEMWQNPAFQVDQIKVDLSLLHKHDAEVRKPLVDALEKFLDNGVTWESIDAANDALAKRQWKCLAKVKQ